MKPLMNRETNETETAGHFFPREIRPGPFFVYFESRGF
jgi:hypothetical protein